MLRLSCCLLTILAGVIPLTAKTLNFEAEKCHIDVPDDWKQQDSPGNKLAATNINQTKSVVLRIAAVGSSLGIDNAGFASGVEKSVTSNGATISGRSQGNFAGLESRIWDATQTAPAGIVYMRMIVVMANGNAYALVTQKLGSQPTEDDQLNGIAQSFGFIDAPEPQHPVDPNEALSKRTGEVIGGFLFLVAAFATIKWLTGGYKRKKT